MAKIQNLVLCGTLALAAAVVYGQTPQPLAKPKSKFPVPTNVGNMAHTTPMMEPRTNALPQARPIGQPTGPLPNTKPWMQPPNYPQAQQVRPCKDSSKPNCGN